ncbi:MAG TPA: hypothetical protein VM848_01495 [Acidimicrobiia bacterium]|nr:hypothetical protein [Acidimicrobiia bacterium]
MAARIIKIAEETSPRNVFVWALDWPGWCRSGRDLGSAHEALLAAADRYALVAAGAGIDFPPVSKFEPGARFEPVAQVEGGSGTAFGVPSIIIDDDRRAVNSTEAARLAALVASSWSVFDAVASTAPETLRKGPRGGGRDTSKIIAHVDEADGAYAREIGIKQKPPTDRAAVEAIRASILDVLGRPSDGSPLADRKWPQRYAARRIAWHSLDHAWEIEDKSTS